MLLMLLRAAVLALSCGLWCVIGTASAQDYPSKPIKIIVPSGPGSLTDILPRLLLPEMSRLLGQPIIMENIPGAGGILGIKAAKQAPPDGYTLLIVNSTQTIPSLFMKDPGFDLLNDFRPVSILFNSPIILAAYIDAPWRTFDEMIAFAKANPGKLNHGTPGGPDLFTLYMGEVKAKHGITVVDVPYKTSTAFHQALATDEVQLAFGAIGATANWLKLNKIRPLAVSGDARYPAFPNVPTFAELGLPRIQGLNFMAFVPAGTPKAVVDKLHGAFIAALRQPDIKPRALALDLEVVGSTPEAMGANLSQALAGYKVIAQGLGIRPE